MFDEDRDLSDRDTDLEDSGELTGGSWQEEKEGASGDSPSRRAVCHLLAPPLERSGRETPVSVDSIPLEWDHTVDVGGSSSHEEDEEATFYSALSGNSMTRGVLSWPSQQRTSFRIYVCSWFRVSEATGVKYHGEDMPVTPSLLHLLPRGSHPFMRAH